MKPVVYLFQGSRKKTRDEIEAEHAAHFREVPGYPRTPLSFRRAARARFAALAEVPAVIRGYL